MENNQSERTQKHSALTRLRSVSKKRQAGYVVVLVVVIILIAVAVSKLQSPTHLQPVADNAVIREYRDKLPALKDEARKSPDNYGARRAYAQALYVTGDKEGAKTEYEAAAQLNPKDASTQNNLGNVYRDLKDYTAATNAYRSAYQLDPAHINAYVNLATMQSYTLKKPADAVATYKLAVSKNGQSPELMLLLGDAYEQNKQKDLALSTYRSVLDKDPDNSAAKRNIERLTR